MGASHIYQNFIALNKWAHPLQPDAIISFSGHNELSIPETSRSDADELAIREGGLLYVLRYSASPRAAQNVGAILSRNSNADSVGIPDPANVSGGPTF